MQAHFRKNAWILAILLGACVAIKTPYFETAPSQLLKEDRQKFAQALEIQKKGQTQLSVEMWQKFVKEHPRSFEAHNNLGMAYYANDQLGLALEEFHKAHELEPTDMKIRENLIRTLKFQTALLTENKEYERAIENWGVISDLSIDEKEKIAYKIEELEDRIFERIKVSNNLDDYKTFLQHYPESPYADAARKKIEDLSQVVEAPVSMSTPMSPPEMAKPAPATPAPAADTKAEKGKKIKITSKSLRVRATPSLKGKTIARVKGGAIVQLLTEKGGWYKIKYAKGKVGWISKKYTKPVK